MNTIRNIRIATGMKKIELGGENMAMVQIGEVLRQHRDALITRLLSDPGTYIKYQFQTPPSKDQIDRVRHKLLDLRNSALSMSRYSVLIGDVLEHETTYVTSEPFYHEINEVIGEELNPSQLTLMN